MALRIHTSNHSKAYRIALLLFCQSTIHIPSQSDFLGNSYGRCTPGYANASPTPDADTKLSSIRVFIGILTTPSVVVKALFSQSS
jgi:hypothetical protein